MGNLDINCSFHIVMHRLKGLFVPLSLEQNFVIASFPYAGEFMGEEGI